MSSASCGCSTCGCDVSQSTTPGPEPTTSWFRRHLDATASAVLLGIGLLTDFLAPEGMFTGLPRLSWYLVAYLPVALPVFRQAWEQLRAGNVFTEFFLMGIATIGAFYIGEYPEGVTVMLFYAIGEAFQHSAVQKARGRIKALLDVRPESARLVQADQVETVHPEAIAVGQIIQVRPGERVPLDGVLVDGETWLDTAALTGESVPRRAVPGDLVMAGTINQETVIQVRVSKPYDQSAISRILHLVQEASGRKAKTEQFIRSFARVYTPAVVALATLLIVIPYFVVSSYDFNDWLYRGLVFLVISCPCALVISIPLGYFGGIGAASHHGILVKGSNFLDVLQHTDTVVFDKTGTLTEGTFTVTDVHLPPGFEQDILPRVLAAEQQSTHPVARAVVSYARKHVDATLPAVQVRTQQELAGRGVKAVADGKTLLIGNRTLLLQEGITVPEFPPQSGTVVHLALDGTYTGWMRVADTVKPDAAAAISRLRKAGVRRLVMLSGDTPDEADRIGRHLGFDQSIGGLLPEDKAREFGQIKSKAAGKVAYAGDGINDAPVLALADAGIAMGAYGSDAAIETADVVIQTDQPSRIATAIDIARATRSIVWQNIALAMGIKLLFLSLGALGVATLWEAVFADVGVALLAILNAVRIQSRNFDH